MDFEISVIIPVYNRRDLVLQAVQSVQKQSFSARKIIVADDGSTDGLCFSDFPFGVDYLKLPHNGFPGAVRNRAVERADTQWIAFLDSDDLWHPDKLFLQKKRLEETRLKICHTRETWNRNGRIISQAGQKHQHDGDIFADCLKKCIIGPSTTVMSRELFCRQNGFREDLQVGEDYEFWLRISAEEEVCYCAQELIVKRAGHGGQLSELHGQIEIFRIKALKDLFDRNYFTSEPKRILVCKELVRKLRIYAQGCTKRGKNAEAEESLLAATKLETDCGFLL